MTCHNCQLKAVKAGKDRKGNQRYRCDKCKRRFQEQQEKLLDTMRLPEEKALLVLQLLIEGNSVRSIERITGVKKRTILSLLAITGERCEQLMRERIKDVPVRDIQADEMWGFVKMKEKTATARLLQMNRSAMPIHLSASSAIQS